MSTMSELEPYAGFEIFQTVVSVSFLPSKNLLTNASTYGPSASFATQ